MTDAQAPQGKMADMFNRAVQRGMTNPNEVITLYFSPSEAQQYGAMVAILTDEQGGQHEVAFTRLSTDRILAGLPGNISDEKGNIKSARAWVTLPEGFDPSPENRPDDEQLHGQCLRKDMKLVGIGQVKMAPPQPAQRPQPSDRLETPSLHEMMHHHEYRHATAEDLRNGIVYKLPEMK